MEVGQIVENPFVEISENGHVENKKTQVYLSKNDNPIVEKIYSKVTIIISVKKRKIKCNSIKIRNMKCYSSYPVTKFNCFKATTVQATCFN